MAKLTTDFYQRLHQSRMVVALLTIIGLFLGLWFCATAILDLIAHEQEAIFHTNTLAEGKNTVISVDVDQVDMTNKNKLIHITGEISVDEIIVDELIQLEVTNVIKLRRIVKMYQWQEDDEHNYKKVWSEQPIDSEKYSKHNNPSMPITSKLFTANQVILGDFVISNELVEEMDHYQPLFMKGLWQEQENIRDLLPNKELHFISGNYYIGKDPEQPQVGDLQLNFIVILPENISIIAKQQAQLSAYQTVNGGTIELFEYGILTSDEMFKNARINLFINNLLPRLENIFAIFIGVYIVFHTLWIASPSSFNSSNFRVWLIALVISPALTLVIIAFSWYEYNSIISKLLFIVSIIILYLLKFSYKPKMLVQEITIPHKKN